MTLLFRLSGDLPKLTSITHPHAYLYRAVRNQVLRQEDCWDTLPEEDCTAMPSTGCSRFLTLKWPPTALRSI